MVWGCIIVSIYFTNSNEYTYDELGFATAGCTFFNEFFIEQNFFGEIWQESMDCFGSNNPKAGMLILGAIYKLWDIVLKNVGLTFVDAVLAIRYLNSVFAALSVIFIFLFVSLFSRGLSKFIVVLLFLINPIFRSIAVSLTPEVHMLFFVLASLFVMGLCIRNMANSSYLLLFLLSGLIGLSISCRIYGFCIYLTFLLSVLFTVRKDIIGDLFLRFTFVTILAGFVFYITNPSCYCNFLFGLKEMTIGHMAVLEYDCLDFNFSELKHLFTYPYLLFRVEAFDILQISVGNAALQTIDYIFICLGYILMGRGLFLCFSFKKYLPVFWFVASHFWLVYPLLVLGGDVLSPKSLVLPMSSVVCLASFSFQKNNK